ncbi:MAG: phytanoyl-CoA dioxygenase family protein [Candidatus Latescibacteria bacterium]|nr:phytanoyl-CoA dioxygenase family protein [Candidatus Latescibacterota bacterium]
MSHRVLSAQQLEQFEEDGYAIVENLFSAAEVGRILDIARADHQLAADLKPNHNYEGQGLDTIIAYRPRFADDVYSAVGRSRRLVEPLEQLFGEEARNFYQLETLKDPNTGGWQWHQDYGYHHREFLYPSFISVMFALDPATRANGCLRVVRGSNRLGRLDHVRSGSQLAADPQRVGIALQHLEEIHCEMAPGSALYFHGNTLHASDPNLSAQSRWAIIFAYVADSNFYVLPETPENLRVPVDKLDDAQFEALARRHWERVQAQPQAV